MVYKKTSTKKKLFQSKPQLIASYVYLLVVIVCLTLAFDFDGSVDTTWTLVLILLTLPCSLISILFAWALIHGAGLEFFTLMYLVFAGLNVLGVNAIINYSRKNRIAEANEHKKNESL